MTSANELHLLERFLYEKLHGDSALLAAAPGGVWADVIPEDTILPAVVFQYQGGSEVRVFKNIRIMVNAVYLVKVVARARESTTLEAACNRVDAVLEGAQGLVGAARVYSCVRDSPFSLPVSEKGITYRQVGGVFRLQIQQPAAA